MQPWPDLRHPLAGIDWVIVGGVATRVYMAERTTYDLDILIRKRDKQQALKQLQAAGYTLVSDLAIPGYYLRSPAGVAVALLFSDAPWLDKAFAQPQTDAAGFPILALPYLVLLKLLASRLQDVTDISRMLGRADEKTLATVRDVIAKYSPNDSEDLESLIFLGRQEYQEE